MSHINELSTAELKSLSGNPSVLLADIRPIEAYNGWPLKGEKRGGHIKGAASFPFEWLGYEFELQELFLAKGILPERRIVLYGYPGTDSSDMAGLLVHAGYRDVSVYGGFLDEWTADPELPMDRLKNYRSLVYPAWLWDLIQGGKPVHYENKRYVVCHAHYDNPGDYDKGHIPGAISLNTLSLESPETWNCRTPAELKESLEKAGITHDTTVILYGRFSFPDNNDPFPGRAAGHLGSIRCAFIMLYAGVRDVRILNGGISAWERSGYHVSKEKTQPVPADDFGSAIPGRPELVTGITKARELLASKGGELVSIRSWPEFIGEVSGYHYIERKGRIPGAVFGNCGSDAYHMENYRNLDHSMREYHEIAANWAEAGIIPEKELAFYCGTGWRGSEAFFNAWLMGWPRISVYDGGWYEWSSDPDNPIETGIPGNGTADR